MNTSIKVSLGIFISIVIVGSLLYYLSHEDVGVTETIYEASTPNVESVASWGELRSEQSGWKQYTNNDLGIKFKFKDEKDETIVDGNQNYVCLKRKDQVFESSENDIYRCYVYINFQIIFDENYHESYKGMSYDGLEQYLEYYLPLKKYRYPSSETILDMKRVKNTQGTAILIVHTREANDDTERERFYTEFNADMYGNYKKGNFRGGNDYIMFQYDTSYPSKEKEQQFHQVIDSFELIESTNPSASR